jgi:hypothetical protein
MIPTTRSWVGALAIFGSIGALACAKVAPSQPSTGATGSGNSGGIGSGGAGRGGADAAGGRGGGGLVILGTGGMAGTGGTPPPPLTDFPADPIFVDPTIPANAPSLFSAEGPAGSAPCITSPEPSTLMPRNWLRPRFDYIPGRGENLFEVTVTVSGFAHALRAYTRDRSYTLDRELWASLRTSIDDVPINVSVKAIGVSASGTVQTPVSATARTTFVIAPVDAPGKIVYWSLANGLGSLKGFGIGEESVENVLVPAQVVARDPTKETCIGCHAATPDGNAVGFALGEGLYLDSIADIRTGSVGTVPSYVTPSALAALRKLEGIPAYSPAHWSEGDRIAVVGDTGDLTWIQLDGAGQGIVARSGDTRLATAPTFRHDGTGIVYVSTNSISVGRQAAGPSDLYAVPFAGGAGGPATPVAGAADPDYTEYYPAFSPDDRFVAFTRIAGSGVVYSVPDAEVFVVPSAGGVATRLKANDTPSCQPDLHSPGLTNDWPKWSPDATRANGKTYYWITFSSQRTGVPQLYVTALVVDDTGRLSTYPALYLWNQPAAEGNHTPAWDHLEIPPITVD